MERKKTAMAKCIAVVDDFLAPRHRSQIESTAAACGYTVRWLPDDQSATGTIGDCEILFGHCVPNVLRAAPHLRWFCCSQAGVEHYMKDGIFPEGCVLTNSSGAYGVTIAEHILMVSLMLLRHMPAYEDWIGERKWFGHLPVRSLRGSTVTLLGTGDIGTTFAHRLRGMEPGAILGVSRSGRRTDPVYDEMHPLAELDAVLPRTDLLVMSLPATRETAGLLSRERIALLPETAYLVNVGRGKTLDQAALVDALNAGALAGAALDVAAPEPPKPDDPLWSARNLILTPHVAGNLSLGYTQDKVAEQFCEDLRSWAAGRPLAHLVDRTRGY